MLDTNVNVNIHLHYEKQTRTGAHFPPVNALRKILMMQHLLFLFLLVVAPIWDLYAIPKLKRNPSSEHKIRYYKMLCAWMWIASALAVVAIGFRPLFTISPSPGEISWLLPHPWVRYLVEAPIAIVFVFCSASDRHHYLEEADGAATQVFFCRPKIVQLLPPRNLDRAPLVGVRLHHSGSLRRNSLPRLHAALLTRFSLDAESYAGAADFLSDLRI
jgi:hypothetical protein